MPRRCMVRGSRTLAVEMSHWHGDQSDPIYAAWSNFYSRRAVPCDTVVRALKNFKLLSLDKTWTPRERRSLEICINALKAKLRGKGIA
jgi:hypothetical protein